MTEFMTDAQLYEMPPSRMRELLAAEARAEAAEAERDALREALRALVEWHMGKPPVRTSEEARPVLVARLERAMALLDPALHPKEAPHG